MTIKLAIERLRQVGFLNTIRLYKDGDDIVFYNYLGHIASIINGDLVIHIKLINKKITLTNPSSLT